MEKKGGLTMEKLATGLTFIVLTYTALIYLTLAATGWFTEEKVKNNLSPVRILKHWLLKK
jgi:hypothetical protein